MTTLEKLNVIADKVRAYVIRVNRIEECKIKGILPVHFRYYYLEQEYKLVSKEDNFFRWVNVLDYKEREQEYAFFYYNVLKYKDNFKDFYLDENEIKETIKNKFYLGQILYYAHGAYLSDEPEEFTVEEINKNEIFATNKERLNFAEIQKNEKLSSNYLGSFFLKKEDALLKIRKNFLEEKITDSFDPSSEDYCIDEFSLNQLEQIFKIMNIKKQNA